MTLVSRYYPESSFGGFTDIDGTIAFYLRVNALIEPSFQLLDLGCGRGKYAEDPVALRRDLRVFKTRVRTVIGLDVTDEGESNPHLDEFHRIDGERWPLQDDSIDLCVCDHVLEHVEEPSAFFRQVQRVLKVGGYLCIRAPNRWSYVGLMSRLIPNRHHARVLAEVQTHRREEDVFPTHYRCNSVRKIRSLLAGHGFEHVVYGYEAEPSYLAFSRIAFFAGVLHQRWAPRSLKPLIFAFARKK